jgi:LPS-assembly protein
VPALRQKTESGQPASNSACPTQADPHAEYPTVVCAITQEKNGAIYKLHGAAEIHYETYILRADEATYNSDTGETTADGHFALDGGPNDDHIRASHGAYNFTLETGRFFDVTGTTGLRFRGTRVILTSTAPFAFTGKVVEKTSPDHYMVYDGTVTSCEMPHPKWLFNARKVVIDVGGNAKIYHSTFVLHGLPILYFPFATHPVERDARQSGFLMPSIGRSSVKGNVIGEAYYWAIDRQMDATVGAEYFSLRGWSQRGEFRARPSETSFVDLNYFGVIDRGIGYPPLKEGGENARLNAVGMVGDGFRGVANIDYLSSFLLRLAFDEVFSQAVYSEVKSQAFLSKSDDGFNLNGFAERYQNFGLNSTTSAQGITTTTAQQVIAISHVPSLDFSSVDHRLSRSPFYWSFDASAAGLTRSEASEPGEPGFSTDNLLGRFDLAPEISLPLLFGGWSIRPELSLHETYYTERPSPSGAILAVSDPVNRQAMEMSVEMRPPALERVFDKEFLGRKWKHVVEPQAVYRFVTGVNNFANIPKFDERDILTDTHEVEYGFITRLYAKRTAAKTEDCGAAMPNLMVGGSASESTVPWQHTSTLANSQCRPAPQVSEIVTWELAQKYFLDPTFGGALVAGERNVFTSTVDLTGIAFATQPRHLSPLVSRLRVETSSHTDTEWDLDYDFQQGRANASTLLANYHIGPVTISGGDAILFSLPTPSTASLRFNQFRAALGYGRSSRRGFSGASSFGFDSVSGLLQFASAQTTYNWDCCGMTMEYRRYDIANVRNENLFRFNFTLANIGSFGDLRKQERLY